MLAFGAVFRNLAQEIIREAVVEHSNFQIVHPWKDSTDCDVIKLILNSVKFAGIF
jgi:hypothetical protein